MCIRDSRLTPELDVRVLGRDLAGDTGRVEPVEGALRRPGREAMFEELRHLLVVRRTRLRRGITAAGSELGQLEGAGEGVPVAILHEREAEPFVPRGIDPDAG